MGSYLQVGWYKPAGGAVVRIVKGGRRGASATTRVGGASALLRRAAQRFSSGEGSQLIRASSSPEFPLINGDRRRLIGSLLDDTFPEFDLPSLGFLGV